MEQLIEQVTLAINSNNTNRSNLQEINNLRAQIDGSNIATCFCNSSDRIEYLQNARIWLQALNSKANE